MTWAPGDIGAERNNSKLARLIQAGQLLWGDRNWHWNHIFVVTDSDGGTIEAAGRGVVRSNVGNRDVIKLRFPDGVERSKVVAFATSKLGTPYDYWADVVLGIDCLFHTRLRGESQRRLICSELGALALRAGGWTPPIPTWLIKPGDLVDELGTDPT